MPAAETRAPLRVLSIGTVYPPHLLGGYEVVWRGVTRRLREEGDLARVLATDYRRPEASGSPEEDLDVHRELDWYWRDHAWPTMPLSRRLKLERHNASVFARHLYEFRPDVLAWWPLGGLSLSLVEQGRRAGLPSVLFVHDYWPRYGRRRDLWTHTWSRHRFAGRLVERVTGIPTRPRLEEAGRWLFNSRCVQDDTAEAGLRPTDVGILSPGVGADLLGQPREPVTPPWSWRLTYVGRVVEQKGVSTAVEAMAHLPAEATLRIVGEGDDAYRAELERLAARLGLAARVHFEAPRHHDEIVDVYRAADVVVFPVLWPEPWGLVPLEAMAFGRPVVATGRGGSGDFLRDAVNSVLFAAGDAAALAAAVRRLAEDEDLRERVREGGYETAAAHSEIEFNRRAVEEIRSAAHR